MSGLTPCPSEHGECNTNKHLLLHETKVVDVWTPHKSSFLHVLLPLIFTPCDVIQLLSSPFSFGMPSENDQLMLAVLGWSLFGFLGYWWAHYHAGFQAWVEEKWPGDCGKVIRIVAVKVWGLFVLGGIPAAMLMAQFGLSLADLGVAWPSQWPTHVMLAWSALIAGTLVMTVVGEKEVAKNYPQMKARVWSASTLGWSALGWMCYLAGYEVMFRGYLLFPLAAMLGVWPAIGISTMIYTVMHFHKGMGETLACLPAGVLICWITLQTESVFLAWAGHAVVALFNTTYQVLRRPEIEWAGWTRG